MYSINDPDMWINSQFDFHYVLNTLKEEIRSGKTYLPDASMLDILAALDCLAFENEANLDILIRFLEEKISDVDEEILEIRDCPYPIPDNITHREELECKLAVWRNKLKQYKCMEAGDEYVASLASLNAMTHYLTNLVNTDDDNIAYNTQRDLDLIRLKKSILQTEANIGKTKNPRLQAQLDSLIEQYKFVKSEPIKSNQK